MAFEDRISFKQFEVFLSALLYSARKHSRQTRKDAEKTPYFNHPVEVAELLWRVGGIRNPTVLTAALLHDVLEDTPTERSEILELFGKDVLSLVIEVSDDKTLPKNRRKELQVLHAPELTHGAKAIKIADKICNMRDVIFSPPSWWPIERRVEYLDWSERVVKGMGTVNDELEKMFYTLLAEGRQKLVQQQR